MKKPQEHSTADDQSEVTSKVGRQRFVLRMRDLGQLVHRQGMRWMVLFTLGQLLLSMVLIVGCLIWVALHQSAVVVSTQSAGHALAAGLQAQGSHGWVQTDTGYFIVRNAFNVRLQEELTVQKWDDGLRYLCNGAGHCAALMKD